MEGTMKPKKAIDPEQLDAAVKRERALDELSGHGLPKAVSKNTRRRYDRELVRRARRISERNKCLNAAAPVS
jgi:hypothetical protein